MRIGASSTSDLLHIDAIVATLERLAKSGDHIAPTSLIHDPDYWRARIEALLGRQYICSTERQHAQAVMERLHRIVNMNAERREFDNKDA